MKFYKPFHNDSHEVEKVSCWNNKPVVDVLSYVPFQSRIKALLSAGDVLADARKDMYDLYGGALNEKISDDIFDTVKTNEMYLDKEEVEERLRDSALGVIEQLATETLQASSRQPKKDSSTKESDCVQSGSQNQSVSE